MAAEVSHVPTSETSPAGRKRRRRAPATGASEDCHTCRKRGVSCDRKRPYCSQCLDLGKECSGYRTTLTWGVGVASRGKLRGMTLPVVGANQTPPTSAPKRSASSKDASLSPKSTTDLSGSEHGSDGEIRSPKRQRVWSYAPNPKAAGSAGSNGLGNAPYLQAIPENTPPFMVPTSTPHWPMSQPMYSPAQLSTCSPYEEPNLMRSSVDSSYADSILSSSTGSIHSMASMGTYSDASLDSPVDLPQTPEAFTFIDPFLNKLGELPTPATPNPPMAHPGSFMPFGQIAPIGDTSALEDFQGKNDFASIYQEPSYFGLPLTSNPANFDDWEMVQKPNLSLQIPGPGFQGGRIKQEGDEMRTLSAPPTSTSMPVPTLQQSMRPLVGDVSPRMQYLLDYYDKVICPSLVAFDSPANPYRRLVLPLAANNKGLQNALAALSINNIRMKTIPEVAQPSRRKRSRSSDSKPRARISSFAPSKPSAEEQQYKTNSIEFLNSQLTLQNEPTSDAVLATLLVLCLFHVCDSGFSRFRTQLAGVQKLLKMRGNGPPSDLAAWVEMFFTWFDIMLAPINNRQVEARGITFDMLDPTRDLGSLDQLCGCDGRLLRLIARLGHLNLLRQGRTSWSDVDTTPRASAAPGSNSRANTPTDRPKDFYSLNFDSAENFTSTLENDASITAPMQPESAFWQEWKDLREQLSQWQPPPLPNGSSKSHLDLMHVSEAYRAAALLYTERLAQLNVRSSHPNLQNLVEQVLSHAESIGSSSRMMKFMLWPLFIAGTECVRDDHRCIVRNRCVDIVRETGFYNNILTLDLLEKVWHNIDDGAAWAAHGEQSETFHWRAAMQRTDGDYIVI